ncbi:S-layer homology domain-containing protein [Paenibacillus sp. GYB003]|uniref:S-layer homology domain-containing protein n=1 Tax=Paenibacillus sp. GYB003 TaxID=2994392 RepID=UPI002F96D3D0
MSKFHLLKRASVFAAALLLVSMLVPVLASAAIVVNGSFASDGKLSGQIRFDGTVGQAVYNQPTVTLGVYTANGQHLQDVTVSYATYENGVSVYTIPDATVIDSVYDAVYFKYGANEVSGMLYREPDNSNPDPGDGGSSGGSGTDGSGGGSSGGTGGGSGEGSGGSGNNGSGQPGDVSDTIDAVDGTVDADKLKAALAKYTEVTIKVTGDNLSIPASALEGARAKSLLHIVTDHGTYHLPLSAFNLEELADKINSEIADMSIHVGIKVLTGSVAEAVTKAIAAIGGKALSPAYEMSFSVANKTGVKTNIPNFDMYVKRDIPLTTAPTQSATIALYNPDTNLLSFVPGSISSTKATFWRTGNSIYTVVELNKQFADIASHWAKTDIELLASKLIVEGMSETSFAPERSVTRAEFVALATRAFGLVDVNDGTYFSDVGLGSWYSGMIAAAAKAGIINGYEDGTFRPNAPITREELAAIIVRAYAYAGGQITVDSSEQSKLLSRYDDANEIVWGHKEIAKAISKGFVQGMTDDTLETYATATRAQTVAMLKRVLSTLEFID